jgi:hypothetical protein
LISEVALCCAGGTQIRLNVHSLSLLQSALPIGLSIRRYAEAISMIISNLYDLHDVSDGTLVHSVRESDSLNRF